MLTIQKLFNVITPSKSPIKQATRAFRAADAPKLNTLERDCVSFTSRAKSSHAKDVSGSEQTQDVKDRSVESKTLSDKEPTITHGLAQDISSLAENDTRELKFLLGKNLGGLQRRNDEPCDLEHPIYRMEFRTKGSVSIREKASQKHLATKGGVIENLHDLVGARIILGTSAKGAADKVLDVIAECAKSGKLKIVEIENHIPPETKYQYVGSAGLKKLAQASTERYSVFVPQKVVKNATGYTAIHMLVEFNDGITGEIQILGKDVALFKELEDIPYKILRGKSVAPKYHEIVKILEPLVPKEDDAISPDGAKRSRLRKEFIEYTTAAYKHEREKDAAPLKANRESEFLTIAEFAASRRSKTHLTSDMDFNNLFKLKTKADGVIGGYLNK